MPDFRKILRLRHQSHLSFEKIAKATCVSKGAVVKYVALAEQAGLSWPIPEELDDARLEELICPRSAPLPPVFAIPDYTSIYQSLKHKSVTLALLWEEYCSAQGASAYRYSAFCEGYRRFAKTLKLSMRQVHKAGEKGFVDYSGMTMPIVNAQTGEVRDAEIFVMVLGASNYTYAEASWTQKLPDWIASHMRAYAYFGGVPELTVPDNLKSGVTKADRYEPLINETYQQMAAHYGTAILPARPWRPKDKAKVEFGVQLVQRWILARLRHQTFFSLSELNQAIAKLLEELNNRPFKKLPGSRKTLFEATDKPALKPLPAKPYEYAEWKKARVHVDYHLEVEKHRYSVPYALVGRKLDVRLTSSLVEILFNGKRVAGHPRSFNEHGWSTQNEHRPKAHQAHADWNQGRFLNWAFEIGPRTKDVVRHLLENRPHPEHGFRSCLGLLSLSKRHSPQRLEAACARAVALGTLTLGSVTSILKVGLDKQPLPVEVQADLFVTPQHPNIRGAGYYQ